VHRRSVARNDGIESPVDEWIAELIRQAQTPKSFDDFDIRIVVTPAALAQIVRGEDKIDFETTINEALLRWIPRVTLLFRRRGLGRQSSSGLHKGFHSLAADGSHSMTQ
jgi:hypothetical protein